MKFPLLLLFSTFCFSSFAQNCSDHTLFKKGVQLEYDLHSVQVGGGNGVTKKIMRLLFEVTGIEEHSGSTYSTIVKKGYSLNSDEHSERTTELECEGKNLLIPFDFYGADTFYLRDIYPSKKGKKGIAIANTPLKNDASYIVPFNLEGVDNLELGVKRYVQKGMMSNFGTKQMSAFENLITIKTVKLIGKESVKTPAGVFDCYKFSYVGDLELNNRNMEIKQFLYFNNEIGLVKFESPGGFIELAGIKK